MEPDFLNSKGTAWIRGETICCDCAFGRTVRAICFDRAGLGIPDIEEIFVGFGFGTCVIQKLMHLTSLAGSNIHERTIEFNRKVRTYNPLNQFS